MLHQHRLLLFLFFPLLGASPVPNASLLLLPHVHSDPDSVAREVKSQVESSQRRALLEASEKEQQCLTGNPIDDCWRCYGTDWREDRQRLADCGIGFGRAAMGGKGGPFYVVTDPSDPDPVNPPPGTLRYGVIQEGPLWITFDGDMNIRLNEELIVNSFKTIDGRGAVVHITGGGCITLQYVSNIIIHNVHVHHCVPAGEANVRSSPTHYGWRTRSDGDGISIYSGRQIWIDHCALSYCTDGLIDAIMGSTAITISNSYFSHHNEVMLLGHTDDYLPDSGMQVTIAFNRFGEQVVQRMPRCRRGYFHVVNNDYTTWEMYAIGGSAKPTINSQGNRYLAPANPNAKEVTKRVDTAESEWSGWNWRTEGDVLVNGAFFVPSGEGLDAMYAKATSVDPKSATLIDQLTMGAGVLGSGPSGPFLVAKASEQLFVQTQNSFYIHEEPSQFYRSVIAWIEAMDREQARSLFPELDHYFSSPSTFLCTLRRGISPCLRDNGDGTGNSVNYGGSAAADGGDGGGAGYGYLGMVFAGNAPPSLRPSLFLCVALFSTSLVLSLVFASFVDLCFAIK